MKNRSFSFDFFAEGGKLACRVQLDGENKDIITNRPFASPENDKALVSQQRFIEVTTAELLSIYRNQFNKGSFNITAFTEHIRSNGEHIVSIQQILDRFIRDWVLKLRAKNANLKSFRLHDYQCKKFRSFLLEMELQDLHAEDINQRHLEDYHLWLLRSQTLKGNTAQDLANKMVHVMHHAVGCGLVKEHCLSWIKRPRQPSDILHLTISEFERFINFEPADDNQRVIQRLFIIMARTGMDFRAMQSRTPDALTATYLKVPRHDGKAAHVPISKETRMLIERCRPEKGDFLFPQMRINRFNSQLSRMAKKMKLGKQISTTSARLTFAKTLAFPAGLSVETVSTILGHARIQYTANAFDHADIKATEEMRTVMQNLQLS